MHTRLPALNLSGSLKRRFSFDFEVFSMGDASDRSPTCIIIALFSFLGVFAAITLRDLTKATTSLFSETSVAPTLNRSHVSPLLILYVTCPIGYKSRARRFNPALLPGPSRELRCNPETNAIDCHEAVPMLTFLIENYDAPLAEKYVFIHGHEFAWHHTGSVSRRLASLINTRYFKQEDFGGLFEKFYAKTAWGAKEDSWVLPLYKYLYEGTSMPHEPARTGNQHPCCATFFMNASLTRTRSRQELIHIRNRLRQWSRENANIRLGPSYYCGRALEYTWHLLLANKSFVPKPY